MLARKAPRTARPGIMPKRPARGAALKAQLALPRRLIERRVVTRRRGQWPRCGYLAIDHGGSSMVLVLAPESRVPSSGISSGLFQPRAGAPYPVSCAGLLAQLPSGGIDWIANASGRDLCNQTGSPAKAPVGAYRLRPSFLG